MKLKNESDLLNLGTRAKIIEELCCPENQARKLEAFKRYQCYKDQTHLYVINHLLKQFDRSTVVEMSYAVSNIALVRKIIDKLARVYKYGVERDVPNDKPTTEAIAVATKESNVNQCFKKTNRYFKLEKNCVQYLVPKDCEGKKTIQPMVLAPFLYDVVEYEENPEKPLAYILSDYTKEPEVPLLVSNTPANHNDAPSIILQSKIAGKEQTEPKTYIFWSESYHFTCNENGEIISTPGEVDNPIEMLPFVNYAEDQDGCFWATGGGDLVDGAILVNSMLTNIYNIAITQGYGQLVIKGMNLPRNLKVGPTKAILLEYTKDDPTPELTFETASPPLDQLRSLVEMHVALLLSTNNLSTSGVSSSLNGGVQFPSGIAMMLDKSESIEDVEDQRQVFIDNEPVFWDIYAKWHTLLKSRKELTDELQAVTFAPEFDVSIKYGKPTAIETDKDRLDVLKQKEDLGIVSHMDLLKSEYPLFTKEQLTAKMEEIMKEAQARLTLAQENMKNGSQGSQNNQNGNLGNAGDSGNGRGETSGGGLPSGADNPGRSPSEKPNNG